MPPQSLPSLNALRAFEAAARHLSFSKAAEELHVTPAAVSHQVKALEDHLGVALFHRLSRGLALSDAALNGLPELQKGFCALTKAVDKIRGADEGRLLVVESAPTFAARWLTPRLPKFREREPNFDVRLVASLGQIDSDLSNQNVVDMFRSGEVNTAIRFGRGNYPGCRVDPLFAVDAVPLCSPGLMQGPNALRSPSDLANHTLLHDDTPYLGHPSWSAWMQVAGVADMASDRGPRFNSVQLVLQAAVEGQGVALSIDALAADDLAAGRLIIPFDVRLPMEQAFYLVTLEADAELQRLAAFRNWIIEETAAIREQYPV